MLYEIINLTKNYDGRHVLDLSLSLEKGRVTGLLGPNGAGKTTLLEVLAFLSQPTSGKIYYKGSGVDFEKTDLIRLRKEAVLVQQKPILFTATVFNNVEFPLKIRDVKKVEREKMVHQLLAIVGMERFSRAMAHRLSGGETQRVAIAQALACSPEVILMDEPTASVDVENQIIIECIIRDINRLKGISVIFTTHDRIQASRIADDIVFIYEGKITESVHENIFSGNIEKDSKGMKFCVIQENLKIPVLTEKTGQVRISVNPVAVSVKDEFDDLENDYKIKGRLIQLTDEKGSVRALVDIGVPLSFILSDNIVREAHLRIGGNIWLIFDPEKVEVF